MAEHRRGCGSSSCVPSCNSAYAAIADVGSRQRDEQSAAKADKLSGAVSGVTPKQIGKYQILDRLAVGGMAELFKAKLEGNLGFEKLVAIKKILPHLATDRSFL